MHNATLSDHSVTEPQSILRTFPHNDTSSEQQGLLEGLQEDTNYKIVITASNRYGSSPSSSPVSFKTLQGETGIKLVLFNFRLKLNTSILTFFLNNTGSYYI